MSKKYKPNLDNLAISFGYSRTYFLANTRHQWFSQKYFRKLAAEGKLPEKINIIYCTGMYAIGAETSEVNDLSYDNIEAWQPFPDLKASIPDSPLRLKNRAAGRVLWQYRGAIQNLQVLHRKLEAFSVEHNMPASLLPYIASLHDKLVDAEAVLCTDLDIKYDPKYYTKIVKPKTPIYACYPQHPPVRTLNDVIAEVAVNKIREANSNGD